MSSTAELYIVAFGAGKPSTILMQVVAGWRSPPPPHSATSRANARLWQAFLDPAKLTPVMALGFAVTNRHHANALTGGRINWELFYELTTYLAPPWWLDRQKLATNGPSVGLVRVEFEDGSTTHYDPNDPADCRRVEGIRTEIAAGLRRVPGSAE